MHWCHNTQKKQKQLNHIPKCLQPVHAGMLTMGKMLIHVYQLDFFISDRSDIRTIAGRTKKARDRAQYERSVIMITSDPLPCGQYCRFSRIQHSGGVFHFRKKVTNVSKDSLKLLTNSFTILPRIIGNGDCRRGGAISRIVMYYVNSTLL